MRTLRRVLPRLFLAVLWLTTGCLRFESILATARVGQQIGPRAEAILLIPTLCEAENILGGGLPPAVDPGTSPSCPEQDLTPISAEILAQSRVLSAYATVLADVAQFDDNRLVDPLQKALLLPIPTTGDTSAPIVGTVVADPLIAGTVAQSVHALGAALSQAWRRKRLEVLIQTAHPHVNLVLSGLIARVALLSESTRFLAERDLLVRRRILAELDRLPPGTPPPGTAVQHIARTEHQAQRLALLHFQHFAMRCHESLLAYQRALFTFQRAHTILYERVSQNRSLLEEDHAVYEQLAKELPPLLLPAAQKKEPQAPAPPSSPPPAVRPSGN